MCAPREGPSSLRWGWGRGEIATSSRLTTTPAMLSSSAAPSAIASMIQVLRCRDLPSVDTAPRSTVAVAFLDMTLSHPSAGWSGDQRWACPGR